MYFNRELSWLKFNERVLFEADNGSLPILERLKFSSIFSSNLDEFFMVRVASIQDQIRADYQTQDISGYTPLEVFDEIHQTVSKLIQRQDEITFSCLEELEENGIKIIRKDAFNDKLIKKLKSYFEEEIFPVLTPIAVDFSRPFPFVRNKHLYIACKIKIENQHKLAIVEVPPNLKRIIHFKHHQETIYILLEDLIAQFIDQLFIGNTIEEQSFFRVTRNADIELKEDDADDLLMVIEEAVKLRQRGDAIRLEIIKDCDPWLMDQLKKIYKLKDNQIYYIPNILDLTLWFSFHPKKSKQLKSPTFEPRLMPYMKRKNIFKTISDQDIFMHHPYESFDYVIEFIKQASKDPNVLAIKQTLYRVSGDSDIIKALGQAAENGKQVTVLVELMARFDEENNIEWAKKLEKKGVHVIYGIYGYKTHSKITLVVRKEMSKIKRYVHIGTGNYNDKTAKLYTDMGYLTCKENYGVDASLFFNMVFGFTNAIETQYMVISPYQLRETFYQNIDEEMKYGKKGLIIAKMNALVDEGMINKLYQASQAGVTIKLIVRGICGLVPGLKDISDNIEVRSIVGEFLEHSRIYYFSHNKKSPVYISSADWMSRNLNRRVELMFPIMDATIGERIKLTLDLYLQDNTKAWLLEPCGTYKKIQVQDRAIWAHDILKHLEYDTNETFIKALKERLL